MMLTFDSVNHTYRLNGAVIPSVTQILRPLTAPLYGNINPEVLRKAAARGTEVHKIVENVLRNETVELSSFSGEALEYYMAFHLWYSNSSHIVDNVQNVEHMVCGCWDDLHYGGTIDILGEYFIIDVKTRAVKPQVDILQLLLYNIAVFGEYRDDITLYILHLTKHSSYKFTRLYPTFDDFKMLDYLISLAKGDRKE